MKTGDPKTVWRAALLSLGGEPATEPFNGQYSTNYQFTDHCHWVNATKKFFNDYGLTEGWHSKVTNYCIWLKEQEALPDGQRSNVRADTA